MLTYTGYRTESIPEDVEFDNIENKIYKSLSETKYKTYVSKVDDGYEESKKLEELVHNNISEYNEDLFKDEILDILLRNHMELELGTDKYNSLSEEEFYEIGLKIENKILKKITKSGFKSLHL
jgi:hypothetical protein